MNIALTAAYVLIDGSYLLREASPLQHNDGVAAGVRQQLEADSRAHGGLRRLSRPEGQRLCGAGALQRHGIQAAGVAPPAA